MVAKPEEQDLLLTDEEITNISDNIACSFIGDIAESGLEPEPIIKRAIAQAQLAKDRERFTPSIEAQKLQIKIAKREEKRKLIWEFEELGISPRIHDYEYYINEVGQQEKKHLPDCLLCKWQALKEGEL